MTILYLTADLFFSSHITGAARALGVAVEMLGSPAELLSRTADGKAELVILDLSTPGLDVKEVVAALQAQNSPPGAIIAYDAHVRVAGLKAARQAGCDEVLTRGQFHQNAGEVLQPYFQQQATRSNSDADA